MAMPEVSDPMSKSSSDAEIPTEDSSFPIKESYIDQKHLLGLEPEFSKTTLLQSSDWSELLG